MLALTLLHLLLPVPCFCRRCCFTHSGRAPRPILQGLKKPFAMQSCRCSTLPETIIEVILAVKCCTCRCPCPRCRRSCLSNSGPAPRLISQASKKPFQMLSCCLWEEAFHNHNDHNSYVCRHVRADFAASRTAAATAAATLSYSGPAPRLILQASKKPSQMQNCSLWEEASYNHNNHNNMCAVTLAPTLLHLALLLPLLLLFLHTVDGCPGRFCRP